MTKSTAILITKAHPLDGFSEFERSVVRRFLFECFHGLNEQHHKRWLRFWSRLWKFEVGQVAQIENVVERSGPYHRMHMGMEQRLFHSQERWAQLEPMRDWLKVGAAWGDYQVNNRGALRFVPRSTSYEQCSDDEMREVHGAMVAFLHTTYAQRRLWPHVSPARRAEMLETILAKPEGEQ
jgi:hypothetical protein